MKDFTVLLLAFIILLIVCLGYEESQKLPIFSRKGSISGVVYDSLTHRPVAGAIVSATTFSSDNSSRREQTVTCKTDSDGAYLLEELSSEVFIQVEKNGFESTAFSLITCEKGQSKSTDIALCGLPVVYHEFVSDLRLNALLNDTTEAVLEIRDLYNKNTTTPPDAYIFFYEVKSGINAGAVQLEPKFESRSFSTLRTLITAGMFPKPPKGTIIEYGYYYEIIDCDSNKVNFGLAEEERLDTLRISG